MNARAFLLRHSRRAQFARVLAWLACMCASCESRGLVGELCFSADCKPPAPPATIDTPEPPAPVCDGGSCDAGACEAGSCAPQPGVCTTQDCLADARVNDCEAGSCDPSDACVGASCSPSACDAGSCVTVPRCDTGACMARSGDAGSTEIDPGCNAAYPVCPECSDDDDCERGDRRICDRAQGVCIECRDSTQCGLDEPFCIAGRCEECRDDSDCIGLVRCRDGECGID